MSVSLIGKAGRVTAELSDQRIGEVMISVRQGAESYYAYAADKDTTISKGAQVLVVDESPGRVVYVTQQ